MKTKSEVIDGFSERIEKAIWDSGLDLSEICKQAKISRSNLWSYRFQGIMPTCMTLAKLSIVLGVSTDWLLGLRE